MKERHTPLLSLSDPQAGLTSEHLKASPITGTQAALNWIGAITKLLGQCSTQLATHSTKFLLMDFSIRSMSKRALAAVEPLSAPLYVFSAAGGSNAPLPSYLQKLVVRTFELGGSNVVLNCVDKYWNRSGSFTLAKQWCATSACYLWTFPEILVLADAFDGLRWALRSSTASMTLVAFLATTSANLRTDVCRLFKKQDPSDTAAIDAFLAEYEDATKKQPRFFSSVA